MAKPSEIWSDLYETCQMLMRSNKNYQRTKGFWYYLLVGLIGIGFSWKDPPTNLLVSVSRGWDTLSTVTSFLVGLNGLGRWPVWLDTPNLWYTSIIEEMIICRKKVVDNQKDNHKSPFDFTLFFSYLLSPSILGRLCFVSRSSNSCSHVEFMSYQLMSIWLYELTLTWHVY